MIRHIAPLAGILLVAGCGWVGPDGITGGMSPPNTGVALANLEVLSVINTKKTLADHLATWIVGKDCSTVRAQREGAWCVDWPAPPSPPQQVYCYQSIARPTCYTEPYNQGNDRLIGFVPAGTPLRR